MQQSIILGMLTHFKDWNLEDSRNLPISIVLVRKLNCYYNVSKCLSCSDHRHRPWCKCTEFPAYYTDAEMMTWHIAQWNTDFRPVMRRSQYIISAGSSIEYKTLSCSDSVMLEKAKGLISSTLSTHVSKNLALYEEMICIYKLYIICIYISETSQTDLFWI